MFLIYKKCIKNHRRNVYKINMIVIKKSVNLPFWASIYKHKVLTQSGMKSF